MNKKINELDSKFDFYMSKLQEKRNQLIKSYLITLI